MNGMKEVTQAEFFDRIYRQQVNIHPQIINDRHPYTSVFLSQDGNRREYGRIVGYMPENSGLSANRYYIPE